MCHALIFAIQLLGIHSIRLENVPNFFLCLPVRFVRLASCLYLRLLMYDMMTETG